MLAAFSLLPIVLLAGGGDVFIGSDGLNVADHLQYMGFIRDAGENVLFSNRFDVVDDPYLFLHPTFAISGLAWQLGASIQLAFLMWKPVGVLALFLAFAAYVRRLLEPDTAAILAALSLALFFFSPALALADWLDASDRFVFGSSIIAFELWGAGFTLGVAGGTLAVAGVPLFLLAIERLLEPTRRAPGRSARWYAVWAALAGMLAAWLHPWQGLTLLLIVAGLVVWERFDRRLLALTVPVAGVVAPLAYMWVLSKTDSAWAAVSRVQDAPHLADWLLAGLAPAVFALPGYPGRDLDLQERMLRIWPVAAVVLYFALDRSFFYHAFLGLSLPLAILAVKGLRPLRLPRAVVVGAILLFTVPGLVWFAPVMRERRAENFIAAGERDALRYLDDAPRAGPVLAPREPLGQAVPAFAGRKTWVGHYTWTPDNESRSQRAEALFSGDLGRKEARRLVQESRAAFLASDCRNRADLRRILGPVVARVRRFGCATIYELEPRG